jgi:cold shock CspA family protein
LEEVFYPISMHEYINKTGGEIINNLFVSEKTAAPPRAVVESDKQAVSPEGEDEGQYSTICSLRDGFGFIRDERNNNIFFHYSTLTNIDFDELETGMKVKYYTEEDLERTKKEDAPRYRAYKVAVVDT